MIDFHFLTKTNYIIATIFLNLYFPFSWWTKRTNVCKQYLEVIWTADHRSGLHYGVLAGLWFLLPRTVQQEEADRS